MSDRLRITLALPSPLLSPNGRPHPMARARAVKRYRTAAWAEAIRSDHRHAGWREATLQATFWLPDSRRRDAGNLQGSLKAAIDGIVDAGVLEDDEWLVELPPIRLIDRDNPRVEIEVWPGGEFPHLLSGP
jgi:Holliday junction resolvase RusA-like endonuclease